MIRRKHSVLNFVHAALLTLFNGKITINYVEFNFVRSPSIEAQQTLLLVLWQLHIFRPEKRFNGFLNHRDRCTITRHLLKLNNHL